MIQIFCSRIRKIKKKTWQFFYLVSILLIFISFVESKKGGDEVSNYLIGFAFIFSLLGLIFLFLENSFSRIDYLMQLLPIYMLISIFWGLSYFSNCTYKRVPALIGVGMFCLIFSDIIIMFFLFSHFKHIKIPFKRVIKRWPLIIIIVVFVLLSVETLDDWARLDSDIYCYYLNLAKNWDFTFLSFDLFALGSHQSFGYTIWGLIGVYITPDSIVGIRLMNLLLYSITIICFYLIIRKYNFIKNHTVIYLTVAIFTFNPLTLGLIYEINLDTPLTCFYVWTLCALLYEKSVLLAACSILLAFSKETGIILLFGIALGWIMPCFVELLRGNKKIRFNERNWKYIFMFLFPAIMFLVFQKYGMLWRQGGESLSVDGTKMDKIGINLENILTKSKELFAFNFSWILTLVIIFFLTYRICESIRKHKIRFERPKKEIFPLAFSTFFFLLFQYIYITYCHMRYITPFIVGFIIFFSYSVSKLLKKEGAKLLLGFCVVMLFVQCFITIDPITRILFREVNIGKGSIVTTRTFVRGSDSIAQTSTTNPELLSEFALTNSAIYNRQFSYFEDVFLDCMRDIGYDDHTYILIAPIYEKTNMTWISLFGKWVDENLYYDFEKRTIVTNDKADKLNLAIYSPKEKLDFSEYERVFLLGFPYNKNFNMDDFLKKFDIIDSFTVNKKLWEIDVYQIK